MDLRRQMIDETSALITWALAAQDQLPRIPTRRVDEGGFTAIMRHVPGARAMADRWWWRALSDYWPG